MRERNVERRLVERVRELGGIAYKFTAPGRRSVPDRLVVLPGAVVFVECKAPGAKPTAQQQREHERLRALGMIVLVVDSYEAVDEMFPKDAPDIWRGLV